jgi:hypothetical protein
VKVVLISLVEIGTTAICQPASSEAPPRVTVCEILAAPLRYDGHLVSVSGRFAGTDEGSWVYSDDCPGVLVTDEHVWRSEIALVNPNVQPPLRLHPVDFNFDHESERRAKAKYQNLRKHVPERCILVSITGLFETRRNWSDAKRNYPNGTWRFAGFGHLGEAPGQLLVKSQDEVVVVPGCSAK